MCSSVLGQVSGGLQPTVSLLGVFIHQELAKKKEDKDEYVKKKIVTCRTHLIKEGIFEPKEETNCCIICLQSLSLDDMAWLKTKLIEPALRLLSFLLVYSYSS